MKHDAALLFADTSTAGNWENEERESYDVEIMHQEYKERLYSDKAKQLVKAQQG